MDKPYLLHLSNFRFLANIQLPISTMAIIKITPTYIYYLINEDTYIAKIPLKFNNLEQGDNTSERIPQELLSINSFSIKQVLVLSDSDTENLRPFAPTGTPLECFNYPLDKFSYGRILDPKEVINFPTLINKFFDILDDLIPIANKIVFVKRPIITFPDKYYKPMTLIYPQIFFDDPNIWGISDDRTWGGEPTFGEIFLCMTWAMGLTPRPIVNSIGNKLDFIEKTLLNNLSSQPPSISTLEKAMKIFDYTPVSNNSDDKNKGKVQLSKILDYLATGTRTEDQEKDNTVPKIRVNTRVNSSNNLNEKKVAIEDIKNVTFVDIMNIIVDLLSDQFPNPITWDWVGCDSACIV